MQPARQYVCPISQDTTFYFPALTNTGVVFEEKQLLNWLRNNTTCPQTRKTINSYTRLVDGIMPRHIVLKILALVSLIL